MKLVKINFNAFKSLLKKELEVKQDCIGFVGVNESGKSNVLAAINVLGGHKKLSIADTPKMAKTNNPSLTFVFELNEEEKKQIKNSIAEWRKQNTIVAQAPTFSGLAHYHINFDKSTGKEERYFSLDGLKVGENIYILRTSKLQDPYKIMFNDTFLPLNQAVLVKQEDIQIDKGLVLNNEYIKIIDQIAIEETFIRESTETLNALTKENNPPPGTLPASVPEALATAISQGLKAVRNPEVEKIKMEINRRQQLLDGYNKRKSEVEIKVQGFNYSQTLSQHLANVSSYEGEITKLQTKLQPILNKITELSKVATPNDLQKKELADAKKTQISSNLSINSLSEKKKTAEDIITSLSETLADKYTNDVNELYSHFYDLIQTPLTKFLPRVVFWEYSDKYILKSETLFSEILKKSNLDDISRPLVNVFRIGLGIQNLEELKSQITEIQSVPNERSRIEKTLNDKINVYLKTVWQDYDQKINITLERDQIRIEFYDPERQNASYYNMEERSQGCQTFLSFLLTVGAEAKHRVIKDTILLLDEPEIHLHPSGARYMLQELIKIAENNNLVFYATHSIFFIDRANLDRHVILKKEKESTNIIPANLGRVGYFIQEEVLYKALDVNIDSDFSSSKDFNFVFEGDGDVFLFEHYYDKILKSEGNRPFHIKSTSFNQGGKCSDIKKYFSHKPIKLSSKWFFILDKDEAADDLKKFLEGRYKEYINKEIFIYQYSQKKKEKEEKVVEFEDLLPKDLIISTYSETAQLLSINVPIEKLPEYVKDDEYYITYNEKIIKSFVTEENRSIFKSKFKEILNITIKKTFDNCKDEESFKKIFPLYYKWISTIIEGLKPVKK